MNKMRYIGNTKNLAKLKNLLKSTVKNLSISIQWNNQKYGQAMSFSSENHSSY